MTTRTANKTENNVSTTKNYQHEKKVFTLNSTNEAVINLEKKKTHQKQKEPEMNTTNATWNCTETAKKKHASPCCTTSTPQH